MAHRQYADYEYTVCGQKLRVERYSTGWRWLIFWSDGDIETQSDIGEFSKLKRDAKKQGINYIVEVQKNKAIEAAIAFQRGQ